MNIAAIMIPKVLTAFLHERDTVRQGLEKFRVHGYTAVPVVGERGEYVGSVTEGDFLRHILTIGTTDVHALEKTRIGEILHRDFCPPLAIDAEREPVIASALNQNFVPIVDGRGVLCGILTRKVIIQYLANGGA